MDARLTAALLAVLIGRSPAWFRPTAFGGSLTLKKIVTAIRALPGKISALFKREVHSIEVHVHAREERHFEVVPEPAKPAASKRSKAQPKSYPAKTKAAARKKSNAKKSNARKKKS